MTVQDMEMQRSGAIVGEQELLCGFPKLRVPLGCQKQLQLSQGVSYFGLAGISVAPWDHLGTK